MASSMGVKHRFGHAAVQNRRGEIAMWPGGYSQHAQWQQSSGDYSAPQAKKARICPIAVPSEKYRELAFWDGRNSSSQ